MGPIWLRFPQATRRRNITEVSCTSPVFNPSAQVQENERQADYSLLVGPLIVQTDRLNERVVRPIESLVATHTKTLKMMEHRRKRRRDCEKYKEAVKNGKTPGKQLAKNHEEFTALDDALRHELPVLDALVQKAMYFVAEDFFCGQAEWFWKWKSTLQHLLSNLGPSAEIPELDELADRHNVTADSRELNVHTSSRDIQDKIESLSILFSFSLTKDLPDFSTGIVPGPIQRREDLPTIFKSRSTAESMRLETSSAFAQGVNYSTLPGSSRVSRPLGPWPLSLEKRDALSAEETEKFKISTGSADLFQDAKVMYQAASLFEFNLPMTKVEAGFAYLLYKSGEVCIPPTYPEDQGGNDENFGKIGFWKAANKSLDLDL